MIHVCTSSPQIQVWNSISRFDKIAQSVCFLIAPSQVTFLEFRSLMLASRRDSLYLRVEGRQEREG